MDAILDHEFSLMIYFHKKTLSPQIHYNIISHLKPILIDYNI